MSECAVKRPRLKQLSVGVSLRAPAPAPLGVHVSIEGGASRAVTRTKELGCDALQCFSANPRGWRASPPSESEALRFRELRKSAGIRAAVVHASYLINMSSPSDALFARSIKALEDEIARASLIWADSLVVHLGSSRGLGRAFALERVNTALNIIRPVLKASNVTLLLENTAGAGHTTGADLTDIGLILDNANGHNKKIGFCFDTCHAFAAGYAMNTAGEVDRLMETIDNDIGIERLKLIHLNDSKGALGSKLDRHEHIGKGKIGRDGFKILLAHPAIKGVPIILETPKSTPKDDPRNLSIVRKMMK